MTTVDELLLPVQTTGEDDWLESEYQELKQKYETSQLEFEQMLRRTHQLSATLEVLTDLNQYRLPKDVLYQAARQSVALFEADGAALLIYHHDGIYPLMIEGKQSQPISKYIIERIDDIMSDERAKLLPLPSSLMGKPRHILTSPFGASWDLIHSQHASAKNGEAKDILQVHHRALLVLWNLETPYGLWQASLLETLGRGVKGLLQGLERLQNERRERKALEKLLTEVRKETQLLLKESRVISKQAKSISREAKHIRKNRP